MTYTLKHLSLVIAMIYILSFCSYSIKADDYHTPETEDGGGTSNEYFPPKGYNNGNEDSPEVGVGENDPAHIVNKALQCFGDNYIYKSCEGTCRLNINGNLNVAPDQTDEYCSGPCLKETHLVLSCIEGALSHFVFYNKASIYDIRETINEGCSHGPNRGDFNVMEHLQSEEGNAQKETFKFLYGFTIMIIISFILLQ
ncbi:hypothetical protein LIER_30268 [Lithospermum erythrorhizon]|uniref:DUF7731 domain-containing protein n=1 Tax=Lithospermum erythrorhizon TaxID=34254 RepID=A0AAV3RQR4_LITER